MHELYFLLSSQRFIWFTQFMLMNSFFPFSLIMDVGVTDFLNFDRRFILSYFFLNLETNGRFYAVTSCNALNGMLSLTAIIPGINWIEREIWDMFGVFFINHPDLRRIVTDYCFSGYPLRNDFPLVGYNEVGYTDITKVVQYTNIELSSEFRNMRSMFNNSRWS